MVVVVTVRMGRPRWRVDDKGADVGAGGSKDDFGMRPAAGQADQTPAVVYVPDEEGVARRVGRRNQPRVPPSTAQGRSQGLRALVVHGVHVPGRWLLVRLRHGQHADLGASEICLLD